MRALITALVGAALLAGGSAQTMDPSQVLATVGGEKIGAANLYKAMKARWGRRELEVLIGDMVVRQAAQERRILVTAQEIDERFNQERDKVQREQLVTNGPSWEQYLGRLELAPETYKERLEIKLIMEKAVKDRVTVDPKKVEDTFNEARHQLNIPETRRVSHIAVKTQEEAKQIRQQIVAGQKAFGDLAREKSLDPTTKDQGGDMSYIKGGASPLQKAAFQLKAIGDIGEPFQSELKLWHIVKLDDIKQRHEATFDEWRDKIREGLYNAELERQMAAWYREQKEKARVERLGEFAILPDKQPR